MRGHKTVINGQYSKYYNIIIFIVSDLKRSFKRKKDNVACVFALWAKAV